MEDPCIELDLDKKNYNKHNIKDKSQNKINANAVKSCESNTWLKIFQYNFIMLCDNICLKF